MCSAVHCDAARCSESGLGARQNFTRQPRSQGLPRWQTQRGHLKFRVNLDRPFLLSQDATCRDETARVIRHKWGRIESSYRFCENGELSFTIYLSGHSFSIENSGKFKNKNRSTTFMRNNLNTAMYFGIAHVHRAWD